jgi:hypothetical protein
MDHLEVVGRGLPLTEAPLPFIAIPTTAGTGSEATKNAVIGLHDQGRKVSLRDDRMLARLAIVDPALTDGTPWAVTLASGLDAVTQVIEPFVSVKATPYTDAISAPAISAGLMALQRLRQGEDQDARDALAWVSLSGGLALANAGLGAVHGLAGVIGGLCPAPHGAVSAVGGGGLGLLDATLLERRAGLLHDRLLLAGIQLREHICLGHQITFSDQEVGNGGRNSRSNLHRGQRLDLAVDGQNARDGGKVCGFHANLKGIARPKLPPSEHAQKDSQKAARNPKPAGGFAGFNVGHSGGPKARAQSTLPWFAPRHTYLCQPMPANSARRSPPMRPGADRC